MHAKRSPNDVEVAVQRHIDVVANHHRDSAGLDNVVDPVRPRQVAPDVGRQPGRGQVGLVRVGRQDRPHVRGAVEFAVAAATDLHACRPKSVTTSESKPQSALDHHG